MPISVQIQPHTHSFARIRDSSNSATDHFKQQLENLQSVRTDDRCIRCHAVAIGSVQLSWPNITSVFGHRPMSVYLFSNCSHL